MYFIKIVCIILVSCTIEGICKIIDEGVEPHPLLKNAKPTFEGGYKLNRVYVWNLDGTLHHYHHQQSSATAEQKINSKRGLVKGTRRDYVRTLVMMNEQAYPESSNGVEGDDEQTALHAQYDNDIKKGLENMTKEDIFEGKIANDDRSKQVGVHALVYTNEEYNETVVAFRGSYADSDWIQSGLWWSKWIMFSQPEDSKKRWEALDNEDSDFEHRNQFNALYYRLAFDVVMSVTRSSFYSELKSSTDLTTKQIEEEGYYAIGKLIVDDVLSKHPNTEIKLTGHSLGGAIASLVSLHLEATKNMTVDTVVFASPGVRCLNEDREWNLHTNSLHPQIVNYMNVYDVVTYTDLPPGEACLVNEVPLSSLESCRKLIGFGIELLNEPTRTKAFNLCKLGTHSIFRFYELFNLRDDVLFENGTTKLGCRTEVKSCPNIDKQDAIFALFITFHVVVFFLFCFLCVIGVRIAYMKAAGTWSKEKVFPCCTCGKSNDDVDMSS